MQIIEYYNACKNMHRFIGKSSVCMLYLAVANLGRAIECSYCYKSNYNDEKLVRLLNMAEQLHVVDVLEQRSKSKTTRYNVSIRT